MYNTKIIFSGDCIEIYKVNNYVIREDKKTEGSKRIDRILKAGSGVAGRERPTYSIYRTGWYGRQANAGQAQFLRYML